MTLLGVAAIVLAGMAFMRWASSPDMSPLYTGLSSEDAGAVTEQLDAQGIDYKLTGGGGTILVARPDVYKTRVSLSAEGIPSGGGDSYALLDKQGITTDQFTRNVNYQRALQGELARTIEAIDSVSAASVTLTIPQQTVFVGATEDKPTAAVLVKPAGGEVPNETVQSIMNLVASSIPNMSADDVTVADSNGNVLHAPGMDSAGGGASQVEQKQIYENAVERKINDMIAASLGPGRAAVTVSADLDMSKSNTKSTTFTNPTPGSTVPATREQNETTNFSGPANPVSNGPLGVGNITDGTQTGGGANTLTETKTKRENALNSQTVDATTPPGTVQRLSVSVLLDSEAITDQADIANKWVPAITNAAGIVPSRDGNQALQVQTVPFNKEAQQAAAAQLSAAGGNAMFDLIKHVLTLLMIGLVLFFAWKAIKKAEANRVPLRVPLDLRELESPAMAPLEPALAGARAGLATPPERRSLEPPPSTLEGEISELIERQPEEVAQTLRSWLADRRS
jgi:flagellar M-ring protein FliF